MRPLGRPTLADVAAAAGVSRTTVSNAYNRPDQLSAVQRERILAVAADLGYAGPDPMARSLRTRSADALGLLFSAQLSQAFIDPSAVEFLQGVAQACEESNRSLLLIPAGSPDANTAMVERAAVDGFVVYSMPTDDPHVETVMARHQPKVIVESPDDVAGVDFVGIEDRDGFRAVAEHVLGLGHTRLAVVSMGTGLTDDHEPDGTESDGTQHSVYAHRQLGLNDALRAHSGSSGGSAVDVRYYAADLNSPELGRAAALQMLDEQPRPTAIMCMSDALALGVLDALYEAGVDVPGEISVTGFDDIPQAERYGLTTVSQPLHEKGRLAAEAVLARVTALTEEGVGTEPEPTKRIFLPTSLVVRTTTSAPPA